MRSLCCPLRHSNLIVLSSYIAVQLPPIALNSTLPAPITKIHQSSQLPEQPAQITQGDTQFKNQTVTLPLRLDNILPLDQAGNSPNSSQPANQQGDLPWWAQDFE